MLKTVSGPSVDYRQLYEELLEDSARQGELIASLRKENHKMRLSGMPLPNSAFEFLANLQYRVRDLSAQLRDFRTGEKFVKMREGHIGALAAKDREIKGLKKDLADARCQVVSVRKIWEQIVEDIEAEHAKALLGKDRTNKSQKAELLATQIMLDEGRAKNRAMAKDLMQARAELEEERGRNLKLKAQINRDYENSSKPSSQSPNHRPITNNREKTANRPGGQPGHAGHPRKRHVPTSKVEIPAPEEFLDTTKFRPTKKTVTKQLVTIRLAIDVTEYTAQEYRDLRTRQRVHADFPDGVVNDVNYSGNVKAFAFLLNSRCNVSIMNVANFLSEITGGELRISAGMINGLSKEFSKKTEAEQKKSFADLLLSPVMNVDLGTVRVNGKNWNVVVCATPEAAMYFPKEHKGHESVKGTPIEDYRHTLVHDHDKTYYKYGEAHQECLEHCKRYLKDSMLNEPKLKWNRQMRALIKEMIHFRNGLDPRDQRNPDEIAPGRVARFESRYDEIIGLAKEEYADDPPTKYYVEGYNLYKKMDKYKINHLLFLHDRKIPPTNNLAERMIRVVKRKGAQVMTFRSDGGLDSLCKSLGVVASMRAQGGNLYENVASKFDTVIERPRPSPLSI